jgi:hypothetical protein
MWHLLVQRCLPVVVGMMHGTRREAAVTDLWSEQLLEQVRLALAEGCHVEVEIVRLLGARPGQRSRPSV